MRIALVVVLAAAACGGGASPHPVQPEVASPDLPDLKFRLADQYDRAHDPRAIPTYRELVTDPRWLHYARRDEALFYFAYALGKGPEHDAVLAQLIATYPTSKMHDAALVALGDAQFDAADFTAALASYRAVGAGKLSGYAHYKAAWTYRNLGDDPHGREELQTVLAMTLPPGSQKIHDAAQKDLAQWGGGDTAADPVYARADQLYALKDYCAAAPLFAQVAQSTAANHVEAAYAHVLSTRSCERLDDVTPPAHDAEVSIPPNWQRLLDATDLYLARVIDAPELPAVQFLRARIYFGFGHLELAARNFREVVKRTKTEAEAMYAAEMMLDADNRDKTGELAGDLRMVCAMAIAKTDDLARVCAAAH